MSNSDFNDALRYIVTGFKNYITPGLLKEAAKLRRNRMINADWNYSGSLYHIPVILGVEHGITFKAIEGPLKQSDEDRVVQDYKNFVAGLLEPYRGQL